MSTTNYINNNTREACLAAYNETLAFKALRAANQAKREAYKSMPLTPTGRTTKAVKLAFDRLDADDAVAYKKYENALNVACEKVKDSVRRSVDEACNIVTVERALQPVGFKPLDIEEYRLIVSASEKICEHNADESRRRDEHIYNVHIRPIDLIYFNSDCNAMLVLSPDSDTGGYYVRFAGKATTHTCEFGPYISRKNNDFSELSVLLNGEVNLPSFGCETEDECLARLSRIAAFIKAAKSIRLLAPRVNPDHYLQHLRSAQWNEQAEAELKGLAEKTALNICLVNRHFKGRVKQYLTLAATNGPKSEDRVAKEWQIEHPMTLEYTPVHTVIPAIE